MKVIQKVTIVFNTQDMQKMGQALRGEKSSDQTRQFLKRFEEAEEQVQGIFAGTHVADRSA